MAPAAGFSDVDLGGLPDRMLVQGAIDGDTLSFQEIVRRYAGTMRAYTARVVGSLSEADDVVQNALITAWRQLDTLENPDAVRAWLMRIASREAFTYIRKRPSHAPLAGYDAADVEGYQPEQAAVRRAQLSALATALKALPDDQRRCWLLRQIAELSYAEIAEEMNITSSTVRGLLARARSHIIVEMEGWR